MCGRSEEQQRCGVARTGVGRGCGGRWCKVCGGQAHGALMVTRKNFRFCLQCHEKQAEGFVHAENKI